MSDQVTQLYPLMQAYFFLDLRKCHSYRRWFELLRSPIPRQRIWHTTTRQAMPSRKTDVEVP